MKNQVKSTNILFNFKQIANLSEINDLQSSKIYGGANEFLTFTPAIIYADRDVQTVSNNQSSLTID